MTSSAPKLRITFLVGKEADDAGCDRFCSAMKKKLSRKRSEGRGGWNEPSECSIKLLEKMLLDHVRKGDPVDIANFCMMIWNRRHPNG